MQTLRVDYKEGETFAELSCPFNKRFMMFLKTGVQPLSYRKYDSGSKKWSVHLSKLPLVVSVARRHFEYVDYRSLPEDVQMQIAAQASNGSSRPTKGIIGDVELEPHVVLHLRPSAPWEVVKAAHRALATIHHPDHGGDAEVFRQIQSAYEALKVKYEKS